MKLRNKKTGEVGNLVLNINPNRESYSVLSTKNGDTLCGNAVIGDYDSLAELNAEWEDYEEPLIKDEKTRKAVRAWAEANDIPNDVTLDVFEFLGTGLTAIRYHYEAKTKPYKRSVTFEYISSDEIYSSQNDRKHTITELCGGER